MLLFLALAIKFALAVYLDGRVYPDVVKIVSYGSLVADGIYSARTEIINDKTSVGPLLWWWVYSHGGVGSLLAVNFVLFLGLCAAHWRLGEGHYDPSVRVWAFLFFAFYVGTHRNVVAGEPDDNLAAFAIALAMALALQPRFLVGASLCLGVGFLFKFWVAIFGVAFVAFLLWKRSWREVARALGGMGAPFLIMNGIDDGNSLHSLFVSLTIQSGYSSWPELFGKFLSTGLVPIVVAATWAWGCKRDEGRSLYWLMTIAYPTYALLNRDAFAATFVLMVSLLFGSFLVAEACRDAHRCLPLATRAALRMGVGVAYLFATTAATYVHLYRDTVDLTVAKSRDEAASLFPYNVQRH